MIHKEAPLGIIVWGLLLNDLNVTMAVKNDIVSDFGQIIMDSKIISFNYTNYYQNELGENLKRCWLISEKLVSPEHLADIKSSAIRLEDAFKKDNKRKVNIDPGLLTLSNFVLATTKNYAHRIYLKNGIFAEVTLIFRNNSFQPLDWTYPDYKDNIEFFNNARKFFQKLLYDKS